MTQLASMWTQMIEYGYGVRSSGLNGLQMWNKVKPTIPKIPLTWKESAKEYYSILKKLNVGGDDNDEKSCLWEPHHFLLQHGRIVRNSTNDHDENFVRLMQIAYNAGQFKYESEQKVYTEEMMNQYRSNQMECIDRYLEQNEINRLDQLLMANNEWIASFSQIISLT
jgi:hypothetical protein